VPRLPELVLRRQHERLLGGADSRHFGPTLLDDAAHGLELYRANIFAKRSRILGGPTTQLPVLLIVPLRDRFVLPQLTADLARFAPNLTRLEIDAGHWVPRSRPDEVAAAIAAHASMP